MKTIVLSPSVEQVIVTALQHSEASLCKKLAKDPGNQNILMGIETLRKVRQCLEATPETAPAGVSNVPVPEKRQPHLRLVKDDDEPDDDLFPGF